MEVLKVIDIILTIAFIGGVFTGLIYVIDYIVRFFKSISDSQEKEEEKGEEKVTCKTGTRGSITIEKNGEKHSIDDVIFTPEQVEELARLVENAVKNSGDGAK